jgi:hypothetical protein
MIGEVLTAYCGATSDGTHSGVVSECVALMTHKFPHLSANEIKEAYRLASIDLIDVNITAYRGVATVYAFGQVMTAYNILRNKALREMMENDEVARLEREEKENAESKRKAEEFKLMVSDWYKNQIETKGNTLKGLDDTPFYFYDALVEMEMINPTNEIKYQYMDKSSQYLKDVTANPSKQDRDYFRTMNAEGIVSAFNNADIPFKTQIINLAKRMLLMDIIKGRVTC